MHPGHPYWGVLELDFLDFDFDFDFDFPFPLPGLWEREREIMSFAFETISSRFPSFKYSSHPSPKVNISSLPVFIPQTCEALWGSYLRRKELRKAQPPSKLYYSYGCQGIPIKPQVFL